MIDRLGDPELRLLTLTGPGGIGKTRLALQVASELVDRFADGVWFVGLAPLKEADLVAEVVNAALAITPQRGQTAGEALKASLRQRELLLLIDNFEQVSAAAPLLAELLAAAPRLKLLVTSREMLHLYGEREYIVPPLALPERSPIPSLERLTQYEAVRLFIERTRAVRADFTVTAATAPVIAEICHRLDGLPLAIELAAARSKIFTPEAILSRLDRRLSTLTGGARDLPARQQTLRGAIDWSYNLLDAAEQALFVRLSVFVGGCTLGAITAVLHDSEVLIDVVAGLTSLVDKSLLRQSADAEGEPRFVMLETIHEYARERLAADSAEQLVRRAHHTYFTELALQAGRALRGAGQVGAMGRLLADEENLRAALAWAITQADAGVALRLSAALADFWRIRSQSDEGRHWLEAAVARASEQPALAADPMLAHARLGLAALIDIDQRQNIPRFEASINQALTIFQGLNDQEGLGSAAYWQACVPFIAGEYAAAGALVDVALTHFKAVNHTWGIGNSTYLLARLANERGAYQAAEQLTRQAVAILREVGDWFSLMHPLYELALLAWQQGQLATAHSLAEEALAGVRALGARDRIAWMLGLQVELAQTRGAYAQAQGLAHEALALGRELHPVAQVWQLWRLGTIASLQADLPGARTWYLQAQQQAQALVIPFLLALVDHQLGRLAFHEGDLREAAALLERSRTGLAEGASWNLDCLDIYLRARTYAGNLALAQGDPAQAAACYRESLEGRRPRSLAIGVAAALEGLAQALAIQGWAERGARLLGAAEALRARIGEPQPPVEMPAYQRGIATISEMLGAAAFASAMAAGRTLSLEEATDEALAAPLIAP